MPEFFYRLSIDIVIFNHGRPMKALGNGGASIPELLYAVFFEF